MKVLITGNKGFIGSHLEKALMKKGHAVLLFDKEEGEGRLFALLEDADFIFHLAGSNRPLREEEYGEVNFGLTKKMVDGLLNLGKKTPIVFSSSIQAELDNPYGRSKRKAEDYLKESGLPVYIYRLSNVFGPGSRPNYNSVVATYCHNLKIGEPLYVRDPDYELSLQYVDDVIEDFISRINEENNGVLQAFYGVKPLFRITLGNLAKTLTEFKEAIESPRHLPIVHGEGELKLFETLCSFLRDQDAVYRYAEDGRGFFKEIYKDSRFGQISINMAYPGIRKGGHYHLHKKEIFETVLGASRIEQYKDGCPSIMEEVGEDEVKPVEILTGYTHTITNVGDKDSCTLMWVSEIYDEDNPDTYRN